MSQPSTEPSFTPRVEGHTTQTLRLPEGLKERLAQLSLHRLGLARKLLQPQVAFQTALHDVQAYLRDFFISNEKIADISFWQRFAEIVLRESIHRMDGNLGDVTKEAWIRSASPAGLGINVNINIADLEHQAPATRQNTLNERAQHLNTIVHPAIQTALQTSIQEVLADEAFLNKVHLRLQFEEALYEVERANRVAEINARRAEVETEEAKANFIEKVMTAVTGTLDLRNVEIQLLSTEDYVTARGLNRTYTRFGTASFEDAKIHITIPMTDYETGRLLPIHEVWKNLAPALAQVVNQRYAADSRLLDLSGLLDINHLTQLIENNLNQGSPESIALGQTQEQEVTGLRKHMDTIEAVLCAIIKRFGQDQEKTDQEFREALASMNRGDHLWEMQIERIDLTAPTDTGALVRWALNLRNLEFTRVLDETITSGGNTVSGWFDKMEKLESKWNAHDRLPYHPNKELGDRFLNDFFPGGTVILPGGAELMGRYAARAVEGMALGFEETRRILDQFQHQHAKLSAELALIAAHANTGETAKNPDGWSKWIEQISNALISIETAYNSLYSACIQLHENMLNAHHSGPIHAANKQFLRRTNIYKEWSIAPAIANQTEKNDALNKTRDEFDMRQRQFTDQAENAQETLRQIRQRLLVQQLGATLTPLPS